MIDTATALRQAKYKLQHLSGHALDAEVLLAFVLKRARSELWVHPDKILSSEQYQQFLTLIKQRLAGQPVAYLLGKKEFWGLELTVNPNVLIPRPETELLVELTLAKLNRQENLTIADLGTGSGAVALALASECPNWQVVAADVSDAALQVAKQNAQSLNFAAQITFLQSDWFANFTSRQFAAIITNPPYIKEEDEHLTQGDLRFEPQLALSSGVDGMDALKHIIARARDFLIAGGLLLLEHGYDQAQAVSSLLIETGYVGVASEQDLAGIRRVSYGYKK